MVMYSCREENDHVTVKRGGGIGEVHRICKDDRYLDMKTIVSQVEVRRHTACPSGLPKVKIICCIGF